MDQKKLAAAFNEWMRLYTEEPEGYEHDWQVINRFLSQMQAGEEPTYGQKCAAYLLKLLGENT